MIEHLQAIGLIGLLHIVLLAWTIPRILWIKRNPVVAITWVFGVLLTPIIGSICFFTLGDPELRRPLRRLVQGPGLHIQEAPRPRPKAVQPGFRHLERMLGKLGETPTTFGNDARFFTEGDELFEALRQDIERAQHEICVQYYIFRPDQAGRTALQLLRRKAQQGVRVYFLYDAVGASHLTGDLLDEARAAGVRHHAFLPMNLWRRRVQVNFRNHRKLVVIDRRVAYTGGFNVGMEYMGRTKRWRHWFDAHTRLEGPTAEQLFEAFAADWDFACEDECDLIDMRPPWHKGTAPPHDPDDTTRGWVQTVTSGPDQHINRMKQVLFFAATRARERLWIASPYLVPDESLLTAITSAALSGVDVRLLTQNDKPDQWLPWLAMRYYWHDLVGAGARVHQYQPGMMHAKMIVVDERFASIGSTNLDVRSTALNFEANVIFYSRHEREAVARIFEHAFAKSREVGPRELEERLSLRVLENIARLATPLL